MQQFLWNNSIFRVSVTVWHWVLPGDLVQEWKAENCRNPPLGVFKGAPNFGRFRLTHKYPSLCGQSQSQPNGRRMENLRQFSHEPTLTFLIKNLPPFLSLTDLFHFYFNYHSKHYHRLALVHEPPFSMCYVWENKKIK